MSSNVRFALREATDAAHRRLDAAMGALDLTDRDDYTTFLKIHSAVLPPLEDALAEAGIEDLIFEWSEGRRSVALHADLETIGEAPAPAVSMPPMRDRAAMLGAAYVLEGSRLGGRMLAKSLPSDSPHEFFAAHGNLRPWTGLIAALERSINTAEERDRAIAAALSIFNAYFRAAAESGLRA